MASKKSFRLVWRLFLPMAVLLWVIMGLLGWYTINHERAIRRENIFLQLKNINATIIDAYEHGSDVQETINFIQFYNANTFLNDLRVSVYDDRAQLVAYCGRPVLIEEYEPGAIHEELESEPEGVGEAVSIRIAPEETRESVFSVMSSNDGAARSVVVVPYSVLINRALGYDAFIWLLVLALAFAATAMAYAISNKVSESVDRLSRLARRAGRGMITDVDSLDFPHDELGDVSREIMRLYQDRDNALQRLKHEHQVAMRANEEKERIKRQTTNNVNHELKTPVSIIKGYLDTMASDPDMPESLRTNFINKAREHADRLTRLLRDVSSITRLDDGARQVELSNFDFHDLVYNLDNELGISHMNGDMIFEWDVPFDCNISGNYTLLSNAMMNLVKNAAKYSRGTKMTLKFTGEDDKFCHFVFVDDGEGVAPEHLPHLFDRFYRVEEGRTRKAGGTGLGLAIVKSTFSALGGAVDVRLASPHGLEFFFKLPKAIVNK